MIKKYFFFYLVIIISCSIVYCLFYIFIWHQNGVFKQRALTRLIQLLLEIFTCEKKRVNNKTTQKRFFHTAAPFVIFKDGVSQGFKATLIAL